MISITGIRRLVGRGYLLPFALIASLFFLWGFARSLLDVLNRHFQDTLSVSMAQGALVQGSTYLAYALTALPAGVLIMRSGYRRGVVTGLSVFGAGALLFIPASRLNSYALFLGALFIIGCGLALLETAANPYISLLGPERTSASRLNLAQSLNGLGCILGPVTLGVLLFSHGTGGDVEIPYSVMGIIVLLLALVFSRVNLPDPQKGCNAADGDTDGDWKEVAGRLLHNPEFRAGFAALFCYEIAEIGINSTFINYAVGTGWLGRMEAATMLSFVGLGLFMLARVAGSAIMSRVRPMLVLRVCSVAAISGAAVVALNCGTPSHIGLFVCYAFEAVMFPTIFAMTVSKTGCGSKMASAMLMITPLGGALGTLLMSAAAPYWGLSASFWIPCIAYLGVICYAFKTHVH